jgi:Phosphotransferase enzyme family
VLSSDGVTHVVKVGSTVRRPRRPFTESVQSYLRHLRSAGVDFVPEPLGYDDSGREVLGFVAGDVPVRPLPAWATEDRVLVALARLIRKLHDAAQGFQPPDDAVWGAIPGQPREPIVSLFDAPELISHQDYCPGNVVFDAGLPIALIDFDLARPTTRTLDCVNALHWWAPLVHPDDRPPSLRDADIARRVRLFADAYGMNHDQRRQVMPLATQSARNSYVTMRAAADIDPVFKRWWNDDVQHRIPRAIEWLISESDTITASLTRARRERHLRDVRDS